MPNPDRHPHHNPHPHPHPNPNPNPNLDPSSNPIYPQVDAWFNEIAQRTNGLPVEAYLIDPVQRLPRCSL